MKKTIPKGSVIVVRMIGDEFRLALDVSHDPWRILASRIVDIISECVELYDEEDGFEKNSEQFKQLSALIKSVKGTLQ